MQPVYAHIEIRKNETEPSCRKELRRLYRRNGVETVRWQNKTYDALIDPALDVYYIVIGGKNNAHD
jgi:hypothetical protein